MKNFKRILLVFSLWGCTSIMLQAQHMYVLETNATQTPYTLGEIRSMTFAAGNVLIHETTGNTHTYAMSDIRYINFDITSLVENHELHAHNFSLFPNPAQDYLNIDYQDKNGETLHLVIYDMHGRIVYNETINTGAEVLRVNISNLQKGMYLCRLYNENSSIIKKIIKN